jgi:hypothetical protein
VRFDLAVDRSEIERTPTMVAASDKQNRLTITNSHADSEPTRRSMPNRR